MQRRTWLLVTMQWSSYLTLMHSPQAAVEFARRANFLYSYATVRDPDSSKMGLSTPGLS